VGKGTARGTAAYVTAADSSANGTPARANRRSSLSTSAGSSSRTVAASSSCPDQSASAPRSGRILNSSAAASWTSAATSTGRRQEDVSSLRGERTRAGTSDGSTYRA